MTMKTDMSDSIRAIGTDMNHDALRDGEFPGNINISQFSMDVSMIKHKLHCKLNDENLELSQDVTKDFPILNVLHEDKQNVDELVNQIERVLTNKAIEIGENSSNFWKNHKNIYNHLLLPFYISLYRKMIEITFDSLLESFENQKRISGNSEAKVFIHLLMAGNACRIAYAKHLLEDILRKYQEKNKQIKGFNVTLIERPKEAVALGAYQSSSLLGQEYMKKINNPPMTIYLEMHPFQKNVDEKIVTAIGKDRGIIIFEEGERNRNPEFGDILIKTYMLEQFAFRSNIPKLTVKKKMGIDSTSSTVSIKGKPDGNKIAFVLSKLNGIEIFRFSQIDEIIENEDFISIVRPENMKYVKKQLNLST